MARLVWKHICEPNTETVYLDQAKQPHRMVFTPEVIKHFHDSGKAMLADKLSIPVPLEHQPDSLRPLTAAELAATQLKHNAGFVNDYRIDRTGGFWAQVNVEDEDTYRKLPRTIKFVSPYIVPEVVDGNGKKWQNVITHVALTSRPRITKQKPFEAVAAALSLAENSQTLVLTPATVLPADGLRVSAAGSLRGGGEDAAPAPLYPAAFSVLTGAALAEGFDAPPRKDKKRPAPSEGKDKAPPRKEGEGEEEEESEEGEEERQIESFTDIFCELMSAKFGVEIPGGCEEEEAIRHAVKAIIAKIREENGNTMPDPTKPNDPTPQPAATPPAPAPVQEAQPTYMAMSLEAVGKIADPTLRAVAAAGLKERERADRLEKHLLGEAGRKRDERYSAVLGKVGKPFADKLKAQYEKAKAAAGAGFSLGDDGVVTDSFDAMLSLAEEHAALAAALTTDARGTAEQAHPEEANAGGLSPERVNEIANEQLGNAGRRDLVRK